MGCNVLNLACALNPRDSVSTLLSRILDAIAGRCSSISVFLLLLISLGLPAFGEPIAYSIIETADSGLLDMIDYVEVAEDETRNLDVSAVADGSLEGRFHPATRTNTNMGFTSSAYWARFEIAFDSVAEDTIYVVAEHPLIDHIEFYAPRPDGSYVRTVAGDREPFADRVHDYRNFVFEIEPAPDTIQTYYVRVESDDSALSLPLYAYSRGDLARHVHGTQYVFGVYYGVMLLVAASSLVIFFLVRDIVLLAYFAYIVLYTMLLLSLNGFGYQYLWPEHPDFQAGAGTLFAVFAQVAAIIFIRLCLDTKRLLPRTDRLFKAVILVPLAAGVYHLAASDNLGTVVAVHFGLVLPVIVLPVAFACMAMGYRPARYFLAGWALHAVGIFVTSFYYSGMLPNLMLFKHAMQIGSMGEFVLLTFAIGDRIALMKRDKENEISAVNRELTDLNQNLEALVHERTTALEEKNAELQDLAVRDSLTGLYNHSTTIELMEQFGKQSQRYDFPMAIIMLDLDHFKNINDDFGHLVGDAVLKRVTHELENSLRDSDIIGRYGGEEFVVILPHADAAAAKDYGRRLLANIRALEIPEMGARRVTASAGISVPHPHKRRFLSEELIKRADDALYKSKRDGRNRLTVANLDLVSSG